MPRPIPSLRRLATLYGLQCSYKNVLRVTKKATDSGLVAVLAARGVTVDSESSVRTAIEQREQELLNRVLEPVHVSWGAQVTSIPARLQTSGTIHARLQLEGGEVRQLAFEPGKLALSGKGDGRKLLPLGPLPIGYHQLELNTPSGPARTTILSAPEKAWSREAGTRSEWGLFAPLYALHSESSWGVGEFRDARSLLEWGVEQGAAMLGTLPLLATFLDKPFDPSPYAPVSRRFWNELYLDVTALPELSACKAARERISHPYFQSTIERLQKLELVDYERAMAAKREVLFILAGWLSDEGPAELREQQGKWERENPSVRDYCEFRAAVEKLGPDWHSWPLEARQGRLGGDQFDEAVVRYHLYAQWSVHRQLSALSTEARRVGPGLYLDFPLGTHGSGYDVWRHREVHARVASVGCPPDISYKEGQNWGFTPLDPDRLRESGYALFIESVRSHLQYAGMLRLDHVMGLHRLWWVGQGQSPANGVYVRYPAVELYAIFNIESHRHESEIVGEDLGTVPRYVRAAMDRRGYRRLFVLQRQFTHEANPPGNIVPSMLASLNNHDMFPFAGFWAGDDIEEKQEIGIMPAERVPAELEKRNRVRGLMGAFLGQWRPASTAQPSTEKPSPSVSGLYDSAIRFLSLSSAATLLINLEDLWLEREAQNIPTTTFERPNWRRRTRLSVETTFASDQIRESLERVRILRRESMRSHEKPR